jgi:hypothetical protein
VYVPTNHVYIGDVFLLGERDALGVLSRLQQQRALLTAVPLAGDADIIHTNLSVREGLEVVVSCGMALPQRLVEQKPGL